MLNWHEFNIPICITNETRMVKADKLCRLSFLGLLLIVVNSSPTIASELPGQNEKPHIVFLISEDPLNYQAHKTIPGKPLVGIRTANHAFSVRDEVPEGYESWWDFVPDILGCENRGYGAVELGTEVAFTPEAIGHSITKGFEPASWHSAGNIYHVAP
jgi:hypothetical protein